MSKDPELEPKEMAFFSIFRVPEIGNRPFQQCFQFCLGQLSEGQGKIMIQPPFIRIKHPIRVGFQHRNQFHGCHVFGPQQAECNALQAFWHRFRQERPALLPLIVVGQFEQDMASAYAQRVIFRWIAEEFRK